MTTFTFQRGEVVKKVTGDYHLEGVVVGHAVTTAGKVRYVVEHTPGFLHIYSEANLISIKKPELCEDEGCPQAAIPHVCKTSGSATPVGYIDTTTLRRLKLHPGVGYLGAEVWPTQDEITPHSVYVVEKKEVK